MNAPTSVALALLVLTGQAAPAQAPPASGFVDAGSTATSAHAVSSLRRRPRR
jgi:hypothetical protein